MTPKIARFLAERQPATPCLVLDVDRVEENFRTLQRALPLARIDYAVKANPAEPGRLIVGDAGIVSAEVVLVSRKAKDDPVCWVYRDIGRFGGLAETEGETITYRIATPHDGAAAGPVAIAGPTCDGADILYEKSNDRLPLALSCGDRVELLSAGAYVTTYASQGFNGFPPMAEYDV